MISPTAYLDSLLDHERVGMTKPPGLDGMRALLAAIGPDRTDIAREKAGIVKPGSTLILGESDPALRPIFADRSPARMVTVTGSMHLLRRAHEGLGSSTPEPGCSEHGKTGVEAPDDP